LNYIPLLIQLCVMCPATAASSATTVFWGTTWSGQTKSRPPEGSGGGSCLDLQDWTARSGVRGVHPARLADDAREGVVARGGGRVRHERLVFVPVLPSHDCSSGPAVRAFCPASLTIMDRGCGP